LNFCGVAVLSAATIHRIKTEKLLQADEPPKPKPKPEITILPPVELPFKPEIFAATINEIVTALRKALLQATQKKDYTVQPQVQENRIILTNFLVKIEEELEIFLKMLKELLTSRDSLFFSELVKDKSRLEAAKTFILLLFAAARRHVFLLQNDEGSEFIILKGDMLG